MEEAVSKTLIRRLSGTGGEKVRLITEAEHGAGTGEEEKNTNLDAARRKAQLLPRMATLYLKV